VVLVFFVTSLPVGFTIFWDILGFEAVGWASFTFGIVILLLSVIVIGYMATRTSPFFSRPSPPFLLFSSGAFRACVDVWGVCERLCEPLVHVQRSPIVYLKISDRALANGWLTLNFTLVSHLERFRCRGSM
jgi:hypothetical protein